MLCSHCHRRFRGNFCSHCGQKAGIDRFDLRSMAREIYLFFSQLTVHFFQTVYRLTVQAPQHLKHLLFKDREWLLSATEYLLFSGTVVSLLTIKFNFFQTGFQQFDMQWYDLHIGNPETRTFLHGFFQYAEEYASLTNILAIPCFTLCSYVLFYPAHYTMGEHLIVNTYVAAQQALFLLILFPVILLLPDYKEFLLDIYIAGSVAYNFWVYFGLFRERTVPTLLRTTLCLLLAYIVQFFFNMGIYYLFLPYKSFIDPFI